MKEINLEAYNGKVLQELRSLLSQCDPGVRIGDLLKTIDQLRSQRSTQPTTPTKRKKAFRKSFKRVCQDCGRVMRYCNITRVYECKCGYSEEK